jgi:putative membrane protein
MRANDELKRLATQKNWSLPSNLDPDHKCVETRLSALSGAEFDREYARAMVQDHDHTVNLFESCSESCKDAELKAWATKTLPTLREHERMAKSNADRLGVPVASAAA